MKKYKVIVACGSGMAASHVIMEQLRDMLRKEGFEVDITATKVSDLGADPHCDLIVTSTILQGNYSMPVVRAISFLTGIGMEKDLQKIVEILKGLES